MTADGGESSPISATRSGLVPAKGGAGKGRKQQSSLRSYFGFTAPAAPSPASPTSPAAPETPVQSQGGDTNTRVVPGEHRQRKDWAGGMEKAQRRGVEPARTDFSEKEMELFRKLTERPSAQSAYCTEPPKPTRQRPATCLQTTSSNLQTTSSNLQTTSSNKTREDNRKGKEGCKIELKVFMP